ncbi:CPBP family intramembrane glutamic endopeptidase [Micrococcus luteus]
MTNTPSGWPPRRWPQNDAAQAPSYSQQPGAEYGRPAPGSAPAAYGAPGTVPPGWPTRPPSQRTDPARWAPGRFHWGDALVVLAYVAMMLLGAGGLLALALGWVTPVDGEFSVLDMFTMNLVSYVIITTIVAVVAWRPFVRSLGVFRHGTWWKLALLPATWFACIVVNVVLLSLVGRAAQSANQASLEEMTAAAPPALMVLMTVVMAPLVEEYLFRHLLIGKLSRYLNVWVCAAVSIVTFVLLHFAGTGGQFDVVETVPYLTLAVAITVSYILMGRSFGYAVLLHMVNNGIAVAVLYLVMPHMPDVADLQPSTVVPYLSLVGL